MAHTVSAAASETTAPADRPTLTFVPLYALDLGMSGAGLVLGLLLGHRRGDPERRRTHPRPARLGAARCSRSGTFIAGSIVAVAGLALSVSTDLGRSASSMRGCAS